MRKFLALLLVAVAIAIGMTKMVTPVNATSSSIVISQVYGGGGGAGAATRVTGASVPFTMPLTPGTYHVRLFLNDSLVKLATSATITVQ